MRRTKEEAEQTKQEILKAALDVFDEKSYDTATLSNIAKRAGVTRGAIYWHFENKFDILRELMDKYFGEFLNEVYAEMSKSRESAIDTIMILFDTYLSKIIGNPESFKFRRVIELKISYTEDTDQINELFGTFKTGILNRIKELMQAGQENGEIRTDMSVEFLSFSILSWVIGYENISLSSVSPANCWKAEIPTNEIIENIIKFIKA